MKLHVCLILITYGIHLGCARELISFRNGILIMRQLTIRSVEDEQKLDHSHQDVVWMDSVNIPMLNASMLSRLKNATELKVREGLLSTFEIPVHLTKIDLESCHTESILIDSSKSGFKLRKLYIHHDRLHKIPANLNSLHMLEELLLNDNEIETVEMSSFSGMNKLRVLALQRNAITTFTTWRHHRLILLPSLTLII